MNNSIRINYRRVWVFILVLCLMMIASGAGAEDAPARPDPVSPGEEHAQAEPNGFLAEGAVSATMESITSLTETNACSTLFQDGADRLTALQNDDGGWDWPLDDGNPASTSPRNTIGPIAKGLALAYLHTGDSAHLTALQNSGAFLLTKTNNFSPSDGYLAAQLDEIFGGTTYVDHVKANYYGPLAAGTYDYKGAGTLYDTAGYVNLIHTGRASIPNLAAWDIGMGLVGAASAGADTSAWIEGVKAEIDGLDGNDYYDVIGLAGAIYGLAYVGEDYTPTAGEHLGAANLKGLADILVSYQIADGGFSWNMNYLNPGEYNETIQETAYAVMALNEVDRVGYLAAITGAVNYMSNVQLTTGGWKNWAGAGENNEVTGEALWAISVGLPRPVTTSLEALPNPAAVNVSVSLSANINNTTNGCSPIASAEYILDDGSWQPMGADDGAFDGLVEDVVANFLAPVDPGIYDLCVRGTDSTGNAGEPTCIMLVVYDPDSGFVTGGGWIDTPAGSSTPIPSLVWDQGFETDTAGWFDSDSGWIGTVTRVGNGTDGISSSEGSYHAIFEGDEESGPFSGFDGYRDTWPGTWTAEVDIYLDPAWAAGTGFDYSVAATGSDGNHQRDYIFHVTMDTSSDSLLVAGSNNTNFVPREDLENINHYKVDSAGWYTFQHLFYDNSGALSVDLNLLDASGNIVFTETRYNVADLIPDEVGGNRYVWFTFINVPNGIAVDEHQLLMPVSPTGKATFGFVAKYDKKTKEPIGNTEFVFKAADLNFHSTDYDWLLVNRDGDRAQFKGTGTINGEGVYKFMLWATDADPDMLRMKIWLENGENEVVIYDNGTDQALGGGNIVIHTKK